jgi:hypothetical protein
VSLESLTAITRWKVSGLAYKQIHVFQTTNLSRLLFLLTPAAGKKVDLPPLNPV